jgi:hypothetical protein
MAAFSPDDQAARTPWLRIGRLLPASLRERVFEPAYFDLVAHRCRTNRGFDHLGLRALMLVLDAYRVGAPSLLWELRHASRRVRLAVMLVVFVLAVAAFMITQYTYPEATASLSGP